MSRFQDAHIFKSSPCRGIMDDVTLRGPPRRVGLKGLVPSLPSNQGWGYHLGSNQGWGYHLGSVFRLRNLPFDLRTELFGFNLPIRQVRVRITVTDRIRGLIFG